MLRKLLAVLAFCLLPNFVQAASVRFVNISTNSFTRQTGSEYVAGIDVSTITLSSMTATAASIGTSTITTLTGTNVGISSMTTTLPMSARKITGLATGTATTDAANMANVYVYKLVCSSTTKTSASASNSTFVATALGCSGSLSDSTHHYLVIGNGMMQSSSSPAGNAFTAGLFLDGSNLDDSVYGQCDLQENATGLSTDTTMCPIFGYGTVGDTSSHTWKMYVSAASGVGSVSFGNAGMMMRLFVFEVQ